jgi:putative redox protein
MFHVTVRSGPGYRVDATARGHTIVLDETAADGGADAGMGPQEAFLAALASCGLITMTMYARRKGWPLEGATVTTTLEPSPAAGQPAKIVQSIELTGGLDEAQRQRLVDIAGKCPVHRLLTGPTVLEERLA